MTLTKRKAVVLGTALVVTSGLMGAAVAKQVHMNNALDYLNKARVELVKANPNKGGHRGKAIEFVDEAIKQVVLGKRDANS